jgi:two-component sensor histidine kinase
MRKNILLLFALFSFCSAMSQKNNLADINKTINALGIDPNALPQEASVKRIIKVWDSLYLDDINSSIFITIPINTWKILLETSYTNIDRIKNEELLFQLKYPLGLLYYESGDNDKSLELLEFVNKRKDKLSTNKIKNLLAKLEEIYRERADMPNAIRLREERINYGFKGNYWAIYRDCGLYEAAIEDFKLFEPQYNKININNVKTNFQLSDLFFKNNQIDSALKYILIGLDVTNKILQKKDNKYPKELIEYWKGTFFGLIAKCEMKNGNVLKAIPMLKYDISKSNLDKKLKISKYMLLSECYILIKDYNNAKKILDTVNENFKSLNINGDKYKLQLYKLKSEYYSSTDQYDSAYHNLKAFSNLNEQLNAKIKKNQAILLITQLEIGKRRSELKNKIITLKDSQEDNRNKSTRIINLILVLSLLFVVALFLTYVIYLNNKNKRSLTSKNNLLKENIIKNQEHILHNDLLLKELHHRVKNNLQLMYSLLNLQKRRNSNSEIKDNLSTVQNRIQTMALVHETLYNSGNFESVEASKYIATLANHLKSIYKQENRTIIQNINIDTTIQLPIEDIISLGLIINEILSNAYKYAFTDTKGTTIEITLAKINNTVILEINDDGPGFSKLQVNENSLGLKLIDIMSAQLKATINTSTDNGVSYIIEFEI